VKKSSDKMKGFSEQATVSLDTVSPDHVKGKSESDIPSAFLAQSLVDKKGKPVSEYEDLSSLNVNLTGPVPTTGKLLFHQNILYITFKPNKPGMYMADVLENGESILETQVGLPVGTEGITQQQIQFDGPIKVDKASGLELVLNSITNTNGQLIKYDPTTDLTINVVGPQPGNSNSVHVEENGSIVAVFSPEEPGFYKGQIYLWNFPLLANEVLFEVYE